MHGWHTRAVKSRAAGARRLSPFSEQRIGLDHLAIGVSSLQELERLAEVLRRSGVAADLHHDPVGPAIVTFRDPDDIQWEFFEQT